MRRYRTENQIVRCPAKTHHPKRKDAMMATSVKINEIKTRPAPLFRFLPILEWLPKYERTWLRADFIAGLTVVALLIPEGMAYAQIAGMPPQTAFYAAP